jgi:hypothetical protein
MPTRKIVRRSPLPLLALAFAGCVLPPTEADRKTYESIAPAHARYVMDDPNLAADAKQRRLDLLEAWRIRVGVAK